VRNIAARGVVVGQKGFFIKPKVTSDRANKSATKNPAGQLGPIFILQRFQEALADAGRLHEFVDRNFAKLALALETFAKRAFGHQSLPWILRLTIPDEIEE